MTWNKDCQETEFLHYKSMILVVYHIVNDLYGWHVECKDKRRRRMKIESGQDFGSEQCKKLAFDCADQWKNKKISRFE